MYSIMSASSPPPPSPLLLLPFELRAQIFHHALCDPPRLVTFTLDHVQQQYYNSATPLAPLTRVSRQVRSETLPQYFHANTFVLHTEDQKFYDAQAWLRAAMTRKFLADLRRVEIWVRYMPAGGARGSASGSWGLISVAVSKARKGGEWGVEQGSCRWVTVTRKPVDWMEDGGFLVAWLGGNLGKLSDEERVGAEEWIGVLDGLRDDYCRKKIHGNR
jgi:hypothetical protein